MSRDRSKRIAAALAERYPDKLIQNYALSALAHELSEDPNLVRMVAYRLGYHCQRDEQKRLLACKRGHRYQPGSYAVYSYPHQRMLRVCLECKRGG